MNVILGILVGVIIGGLVCLVWCSIEIYKANRDDYLRGYQDGYEDAKKEQNDE